jgi:hypothetical protein
MPRTLQLATLAVLSATAQAALQCREMAMSVSVSAQNKNLQPTLNVGLLSDPEALNKLLAGLFVGTTYPHSRLGLSKPARNQWLTVQGCRLHSCRAPITLVRAVASRPRRCRLDAILCKYLCMALHMTATTGMLWHEPLRPTIASGSFPCLGPDSRPPGKGLVRISTRGLNIPRRKASQHCLLTGFATAPLLDPNPSPSASYHCR